MNLSEMQSTLYGLGEFDDVKLPTGLDATVREMTGNEQRNFLNRQKHLNGTAIQALLAACTVSVGGLDLPPSQSERMEYMQNMLSGDRATLLFAIRRFSMGDSFEFAAECPNQECRNKGEWEVDLTKWEDFKITPYKNGIQKQIVVESPSIPGVKYRFEHLDGKAETLAIRKRDTADIMTDLELRYFHIWDESNNVWAPIDLNKLRDRHLGELRKLVREYEGGIDTLVTVMCAKCFREVQFDLLQLPDFMTPSMTS